MSMNLLLEYLSVIRRQKAVFVVVFLVILLASIAFAQRWSRYKSYATIEVARPEVSVDAVSTGDNAMAAADAIADLEISRLRQKVLSTSSLGEIIAKYDLYPEARKRVAVAYIAKDMQDHIDLRLVSSSLANPSSAQKATAAQLSAIAFTLSFEYPDPVLAQKVVNELVSRFLDEDLKERRETASKTSEFLQGQIDILSASLAEQEAKIADFRAQNGDMRPDALSFNQQVAVAATSRLLSVESDISSNIGLIGALRAQLAQTEPYSRVVDESGQVLTTPAIQLRALKSQYATMTAKYGPQYPDVIKLSRQIYALEREVNAGSVSAQLKARIKDAEARAASMKSAYGSSHPDSISAQEELSSLRAQLARVRSGGSDDGIVADADNPAYLQIAAQLDAARKQQKALESQRAEVRRQQKDYQQAVAANPEAEKGLAALARDYDNMMIMYRELKAKKLAADMTKTIEDGHIGRRLAVIDSPELPLTTEPSRMLIVAIGFVLALMAAVGSVLGLQLLSQSVVGPNHLESLIGSEPLIKIPHMSTVDDKIRSRQIVLRLVVFAPFVLAVLAVLFFTMVMPFDVFSAVAERKVGL